MNLGDWEEIEVITEDDERIASITEDKECPIICKDGYSVLLVPKNRRTSDEARNDY